jgi:hypothetical protein
VSFEQADTAATVTARGCWPWMDAGDEETCLSALQALDRAGVLLPHDRTWLEPALRHGVGASPSLAIPWASWVARIGERGRLPVAAGTLAVVVTILNTRAADVAEWAIAPDGVDRALGCGVPVSGTLDEGMRWALGARMLRAATDGHARLADRIASWLLGLGEYPAAAAPRNPPLGAYPSPPGAASRDSTRASRIHACCGVREAVTLWTLPALLAGEEDLTPWSRFGAAVAEPIALLGDLTRLWLDPAARDLRDAALTPLIEVWLSEPELGAHLLRAYAGERESNIRRFEIHSLVASRAFRAHLESIARHALASAQECLPAAGAAGLMAAAADFLKVLGQSFSCFDSLAAFRALLDLSPAGSALPCAGADQPLVPAHVLRENAETDAHMAGAFLLECAPWPGSWEVQRFGVFGSDVQPVCQWFVRGTILRGLLEIGQDVHDEVAWLLGEIPPGELRYYGSWREIPPDADDLGLMLELVAATGVARDRAETWIALLLANIDEEGIAPTWFCRDTTGCPTTPSGQPWPHNGCNAVRLNLLCGLLAFDATRFHDLIEANAAYVLERSGGGNVTPVHYYDTSYAALAFLRFAQLYRDKAVHRSLLDGVATVAAAIRERIAACQRLDGGWGSPQRTAFSLEGFARGTDTSAEGSKALLLERGMRYLGEYQLADGSWPAEPLYLIPLKRNREGYHRGRALTTVFCASALRAALAALA